jgi:hypothetical protein
MTLSKQHECHYAEFRNLFIVMLYVIMLSYVMLNVAMLCVVLLSVVVPFYRCEHDLFMMEICS